MEACPRAAHRHVITPSLRGECRHPFEIKSTHFDPTGRYVEPHLRWIEHSVTHMWKLCGTPFEIECKSDPTRRVGSDLHFISNGVPHNFHIYVPECSTHLKWGSTYRPVGSKCVFFVSNGGRHTPFELGVITCRCVGVVRWVARLTPETFDGGEGHHSDGYLFLMETAKRTMGERWPRNQ